MRAASAHFPYTRRSMDGPTAGDNHPLARKVPNPEDPALADDQRGGQTLQPARGNPASLSRPRSARPSAASSSSQQPVAGAAPITWHRTLQPVHDEQGFTGSLTSFGNGYPARVEPAGLLSRPLVMVEVFSSAAPITPDYTIEIPA
jgi:hypothetical protein